MTCPTPCLEALEPRTLLNSPVMAAAHPFGVSEAVTARARKRAKSRAVISYRASVLFPLSAGATWTYRSGTDIIEQSVDGVPTTAKGVTTAKVVTTRGGEAAGEAIYSSADNGIRLLQRSVVLPGQADSESYNGGVPVLPFAVRTGGKVAFRVKWQGVQDSGGFAWTGNDNRKLQVLGFQTITVAAGSFKAIHVRETRTATQSQTNNGPLSVNLTTTTDAFYVPGIGLARSVVTTRRVASYNNIAVETTSNRKITDLLATNLTYIPPRPDLVSTIRGEDSIATQVNARLKITGVVRNLGQESARPSTMTLYLSSDRTVDAADAAVGAARVKALAPGQSLARAVTLQLPRQPGTYFVATFADAADEADDADRANNWSAPLRIVVTRPAKAA